ncbi:MAG TPA: hypothetical protein VHZ78_14670 [Rhizomicrobium sp.]|jgi:hypothetical protein|nr:hypothetical protein [Rhizomicrobium sp.]
MQMSLTGLADTPALYPLKLDLARAEVLFLALDENAYRQASFLDDRLLTPDIPVRWERLGDVAQAMPTGARPLHFIFHSGHVGSTLLSRLLDEVEGVLPLREPTPLRTLAEAADTDRPGLDETLETFLRLWERGFATTRTVVLKATSSAARLAPRLLAQRPQARAVCLNLPAEPYLATLLAGPHSLADLNWHGPERLQRFKAFLGESKASLGMMSLGEMAAMSWLVERLTQQRIRDAFGARVLMLDFGALLAEPGETMASVLAHFALPASPGYRDGVAQSPVLTRYSKAPEHAYSTALRARVLDEARRVHADELKRGLRFLDTLAARHASVAEILRL